MTAKSRFQIKVEEMLFKYITRFLRYAKFSHLPTDRKEILIGAFFYLLDEKDLVPDNIPNIGYFDDLMVFFSVAQYFTGDGQAIPGVCNPDELVEDSKFIEKNKGLLYGTHAFSIDVIRKKGRNSVNLDELCAKIKEKYSHLGKVEE